ncbi:hypothetical protein [Acinetobacter soli]|uniref:hypothetical protein n=1 Tax=Acinetobacter soli TaxID=487316 RepID=UPI00300C016A
MYTLDNLPVDYSELQTLNLCSNKIIGGGFPFSLNGGLPLIVGSGTTPNIWLQAVNNSNSKDLILLVDKNISTVKEISVTKPENGVIEVYFKNQIKILRVKSTGSNTAVVSVLDLRPIGLNIFGNQSELKIGGSSFSTNTVQGAKVFLGLG